MPRYLNYGGIGTVIGHEITHGFDPSGKQHDLTGNLANWWKPETDKKYQKLAQCIEWQYGNYTVEQINMTINGVLTLEENIADNGGVREASFAYGMLFPCKMCKKLKRTLIDKGSF